MTVHVTAPLRTTTLAMLPGCRELALNFGPDDGPFTEEAGWKVDDRCCALPGERPGPPEPGGPWEQAREVLANYEMAPPNIIRAAWDEGAPVSQRTMVLEGRFAWLRFPMAVRIGDVVDDELEVDGRRVRRWGWSYRTLAGHLEQGQMDWEVWKWTDKGDVEFRIHAFSRRGPIPNPIVALGFRLFGTWTQERFYEGVQERMRSLVEERTGRTTTSATCHTALERPTLGALMGAQRPAG